MRFNKVNEIVPNEITFEGVTRIEGKEHDAAGIEYLAVELPKKDIYETPYFTPYTQDGSPYVTPLTQEISGVYLIKEKGVNNVIYVGCSSTDRLYKTAYRHFQKWEDPKQDRFTVYPEKYEHMMKFIFCPPEYALMLECYFMQKHEKTIRNPDKLEYYKLRAQCNAPTLQEIAPTVQWKKIGNDFIQYPPYHWETIESEERRKADDLEVEGKIIERARRAQIAHIQKATQGQSKAQAPLPYEE